MIDDQKLKEITDAIDRNTEAIYNTAKPHPLNDQFIEQVQKAADFLRFITSDKGKVYATNNPTWTTAKSLANKLETHLAEIRRAK